MSCSLVTRMHNLGSAQHRVLGTGAAGFRENLAHIHMPRIAAQLPGASSLGIIEDSVVRALGIDLGEIKYVLDLLPRVPSNIKLYAILRP